MPKHRQLDPQAPLGGDLHRVPDPRRLIVPSLVAAVVLALAAVQATELRGPLVGLSLLTAVPATLAAVAGGRRRRGERPALADRRPLGTDALTGCADEPSWYAAIDAALTTEPQGTAVSIARLAIELVPGAPDTNRTLVLATVRWREILRPGDTLARLGSTDFGILLPHCEASAARAVLARLRSAVPDAAATHVAIATWDGDESPGAFERRIADSLEQARSARTIAPLSDAGRVAAVTATGLAVRETTEEFDDLARSVAWMLGVPVVVITLFDERWQHLIGAHGVAEAGSPLDGTPAEEAICRQTVESGQALVVSDAERHPALSTIPAVEQFGVAACASIPVVSTTGHVLGTICAMVTERHGWTADEVTVLRVTAGRIAGRLDELRAQADGLVGAA